MIETIGAVIGCVLTIAILVAVVAIGVWALQVSE